jgi:putative LysE/RhtB family amino acid efflux pump
MNVELLARGFAIGFAVAIALGPIGLLVIRRTIERGWSRGLASGVGVATADATYAAIAAFGLTAATELLVGIERPLGILGGAALLGMAVRGLRAARGLGATVGEPIDHGPTGGPAGTWASMVALTLANPMTILSFAALFAGIRAGSGGTAGAAAIVAGVFLGSCAWWAILTGIVAALRARLTPGIIRGLSRTSAVLIGGLGVVAIWLGLTG